MRRVLEARLGSHHHQDVEAVERLLVPQLGDRLGHGHGVAQAQPGHAWIFEKVRATMRLG